MTETYQRHFDAFSGNGGGSPEWLAARRRAGMDRFAAVGFPTSRDEEWRFTPVGPIAHAEFRPAPAAEV